MSCLRLSLLAALILTGCRSRQPPPATAASRPTSTAVAPRTADFDGTETHFAGAGDEFNAPHSFDVDFHREFDTANIKEIRISIDTAGLTSDAAYCKDQPDLCDDDLEIQDVLRWQRVGDEKRSTTDRGPDLGEQKVFSATRNPDHFDAAKKAIADGKIKVWVHPTANDAYRVWSVTLAVFHNN